MKKNFSRKSIFGVLGGLVFILVCGSFAQTFAQEDRYAIEQAEQAVRDKIVRAKGGEVTFPRFNRAETYYISRTRTGVKGYGTWMRRYNSDPQDFSYEARVDTNKGKVDKIKYTFLSDENDNGRIPGWAVGTFYGRNPQTGGRITLDIKSNGSVGITFDNRQTYYATIEGTRLINDGVVSRVTRINNGIRTTRLDNGEAIDYFIDDNDNGGGGGYDNIPRWAVGTFYGNNPQTGGRITLRINDNGSVNITFDNGQTGYATISGDRLTNNGIVSRVTKTDKGIRTTRLDNGEVIDYYTNYYYTGGGGNTGGGNTNANVPSWAIGTFSAPNPQNDGTITLTISADGTVIIDFDGAISYATINRDRLFNNGIESIVSRTRNGIRTTRVDNGERIDYRRQ